MHPHKPPKLSRESLAELFRLLGNEQGLERMLLRLYQKMHDDIIVGFFFKDRDLAHIAHMQTQFLLKAWGIQKEYSGRLPQNAHTDMPPILPGHFDRRLRLAYETLLELGITEPYARLYVEYESRFRGAVVKP